MNSCEFEYLYIVRRGKPSFRGFLVRVLLRVREGVQTLEVWRSVRDVNWKGISYSISRTGTAWSSNLETFSDVCVLELMPSVAIFSNHPEHIAKPKERVCRVDHAQKSRDTCRSFPLSEIVFGRTRASEKAAGG